MLFKGDNQVELLAPDNGRNFPYALSHQLHQVSPILQATLSDQLNQSPQVDQADRISNVQKGQVVLLDLSCQEALVILVLRR